MKLSDIHDDVHPYLLKIFKMDGISESDKELALNFNDIFALAKSDEEFSTEILNKIKAIFELRWSGKKDKRTGINNTSFDYFRNNFDTSVENNYWIEISKIIATHAGIGYLEILVPSIENTKNLRTSTSVKTYSDPNNFFLLYDRKTLYAISHLERALEIDNKLYIEFKDEDNFLVERPLQLMEIYRILKKHKSSVFLHPFAEKLWCEIIPGWRRVGLFPRSLAPILMELVTKYFEEGTKNAYSKSYKDYPEVTIALRDLLKEIQNVGMTDIYHFYSSLLPIDRIGNVEEGRIISTKSTKHEQFIVAELLIQLIKGDMTDISKMMEALAIYLVNQDLSFIVPYKPLADIYKPLSVGPFISKGKLAHFLGNILETDADAGVHYEGELKELKSLLEMDKIQLTEAVKILQVIYQKRWTRICEAHLRQLKAIKSKERYPDPLEQLDYTRKQGGANYWWIKVAQLLDGARLLKHIGYDGYYQFLMPSLQETRDFVYFNAIETYSLDTCILSEDNKTLIPLELSKTYYHNYGEFWNINCSTHRPFTYAEKLRIIYANELFHIFITVLSDPPLLSKKCVNIFRELVESILCTDDSSSLTEENIIQAYSDGLVKFYSAMNKLSNQEKLSMLSQKVIVLNNCFSVAQIIQKIRRGGQTGCVSTWARCLLQIVIDYERWKPFPPVIVNSILNAIHLKITRSARSVYIDYAFLTQEEAILRNRKLMISLLTIHFNIPYGISSLVSGDSVSLWGCGNRVNETILKIFNYLKSDVESKDNQFARDIYVCILESIVLPILNDPKKLEAEPPAVQHWLSQIGNDDIYKNVSTTYYHPQTLFVSLQAFKEYETFTKADRQFIQDLLYTNLKPFESDSMRWVRANVLYFRFLQRQKIQEQKQFARIVQNQTEPDLDEFYNAIYEFYTFQAAQKPVSSWLSFFVKPEVDESCRKLLMSMKPQEWNVQQWWDVKGIFDKNLKAIKVQA